MPARLDYSVIPAARAFGTKVAVVGYDRSAAGSWMHGVRRHASSMSRAA